MRKALVTGGAGFIGSNLIDQLLEENVEVVCVDNCSADNHKRPYWNDDCRNYTIDITDNKILDYIVKSEKPDTIFHLAAEARIQPSIENPRKTISTNVHGTLNVLEASRNNEVQRVVYSSTSSAYGLKNTPPYAESDPTDCLTPYSVSKVAGEGLCGVYFALYGLQTVTLRYFNVYGQRQPLEGQYAPVIGRFLIQKKNSTPMTIIGDGEQTRDFTHVNDVVRANILAAKTQDKKAFGEVFNIGSGKRYSVIQLAKLIGGEIEFVPERKGEAKDSLAQIKKAKEILKWSPKETLEDYLKT